MFFVGLNGVKKQNEKKTKKSIKQELLNSLNKNDNVEE